MYPADVEQVLRRFPDIQDAAVVGVPDRQRGETVKALLVPRNGARVNLKQLERFCRQHLASHKRPRMFEVVQGDLPRNFLGKVLRRRLREESVNGRPSENVAEEDGLVEHGAVTAAHAALTSE